MLEFSNASKHASEVRKQSQIESPPSAMPQKTKDYLIYVYRNVAT